MMIIFYKKALSKCNGSVVELRKRLFTQGKRLRDF